MSACQQECYYKGYPCTCNGKLTEADLDARVFHHRSPLHVVRIEKPGEEILFLSDPTELDDLELQSVGHSSWQAPRNRKPLKAVEPDPPATRTDLMLAFFIMAALAAFVLAGPWF